MSRLGQECGLLAFDKEGEVSPAFLHDGVGGFDLAVERVHQSDDAVQLQAAQQGFGGGNFVALVGHRFDAQNAPAVRIAGADQLGALAAAQGFAIRGTTTLPSCAPWRAICQAQRASGVWQNSGMSSLRQVFHVSVAGHFMRLGQPR